MNEKPEDSSIIDKTDNELDEYEEWEKRRLESKYTNIRN